MNFQGRRAFFVDHFQRYQKGLSLIDLFPNTEGKCGCGCGRELSVGRKRWSTNECQQKALYHFYVIKGDTEVIRELLFDVQGGFCQACGVFDENWEADHIVPVFLGGGGCSLENFQTLCEDCHINKSRIVGRLFNRIPNSNNVRTPRFDVFPPSLDTFRAFNQIISKNIVGDT